MALNFRKADRLRKFFNGCEITMETFERELCVRGYHVYQRIWTATDMPWSLAYRPISMRSSGEYRLYGRAYSSLRLSLWSPRRSLQRSLEKEWTATVILSDQEARPWGRGTSVEPWLYLRTRVKCAYRKKMI